MTPLRIAEELGSTGLCVCANFLSLDFLNEIHNDLVSVKACGGFHRAGIGQGYKNQVQDKVRRDETFWLDRTFSNSAQAKLWNQIDTLQQALNRTLFLGLNDFEGHYASYAEGGFYKRHLDCFQKNKGRIVTLIIYLNKDWHESQGGQLRIYSRGDEHKDINPQGGTLVCFLSQELEHEVLQSHAIRYSFTGWFKSV
ncbi:MAG: 2OG-Fe(II) oxygenase [Pseudobdellovibrionaceae bacterium]